MRDATKQVRDELTKRGVIWGKPAPEYWELLGGMPNTSIGKVVPISYCPNCGAKVVSE